MCQKTGHSWKYLHKRFVEHIEFGEKMIVREELLSLNFVRREDFSGSHKGMRFLLHYEAENEEKKLKVYIWSEPFGFEATPEGQKLSSFFEFSEEGLHQAIDWMNQKYEQVRYKEEI